MKRTELLDEDLSVIDQACSVKMVGYWPSSFLSVYDGMTTRF